MTNGHGGNRPGAGRPGGTKNEKTLEKAEARELVRRMITESLKPMIKAQIANASGVQHFFLRDPSTGQFKRIADPDEIETALNAENASEGSTYWIFSKDPNVQAFTNLLNRAIDKPAEHIQVAGADGGPITIRWQRDEEPKLLEGKVIEIEAHDPEVEKNGNGRGPFNLEKKTVAHSRVDLEEFGRKLAVLQPWEALAEEEA
jgi:hypothetical protein